MKIALFLGCAATHLVPDIKDSWVNVFQIIFDKFDIIGIDDCCGMPFLLSGDINRAEKRAKELLSELNLYDLVITGCPSCYRMFSYFYPEKLGIFPKFASRHLVSVLCEGIKNGKIKIEKEVNIRVTFHDSCELARHMDIIEEPRFVLNSIPGIELVEMKLNKKLSTCCGGGGLMRMFFPKISQEIAIKKILEEIIPLNIDVLVTSCPFCMYVFNDAIRAMGNNNGLRVMDISELVLMAVSKK
ncbi:MAG: (Fe-S)-binding protein [Candidatus Njordarchaeota archaeon]